MKKRRSASQGHRSGRSSKDGKLSLTAEGIDEEDEDGSESEYDASSTSYVNLN